MKVLNLRTDSENLSQYEHLFEISQVPKAFSEDPKLDWRVRDGFNESGTLLVGDLRVLKTATDVVEIHPFPEWLVEILQPFCKVGKAYAVVPNWPKEFFGALNNTWWKEKLSMIRNRISTMSMMSTDEWLAIEYEPGICIKIPAYVPHEFLARFSEDQKPPYLQCFEPNFDFLPKIMGIEATILFELNQSLHI